MFVRFPHRQQKARERPRPERETRSTGARNGGALMEPTDRDLIHYFAKAGHLRGATRKATRIGGSTLQFLPHWV